MRKKPKAAGRAEQAALEDVAAHAGVEVSEDVAVEAGDVDRMAHDLPAVSSASDSDPHEHRDDGSDAALAARDADRRARDLDPDSDSDIVDDVDPALDGDDVEADAAPGTLLAADFDEARFAALVEALLFASDRPLTVQRLRQLTRVKEIARIQAALTRIAQRHEHGGIVLSLISGGYSFRTHSGFSPWVQQLIQGRPVRLSRAQLETLAIVAYRQPITRPEIDQIRGVDSGATLKLLLDRQLIRILGKREEVGRPLLYGTTREFLDFFSLNDLRELPTLREYSELSDESRSVVEKMGLAPPPPANSAVPADDLVEDASTESATVETSPAETSDVAVAAEPATEPARGPEADRSDLSAVFESPDPDRFDSTGDHTIS